MKYTTHNDLSQLFQNLISEIKDVLALIANQPDEPNVHRFRVLAKRVFAYNEWISGLYKQHGKITRLKQFREIFRYAGMLREIHIYHLFVEKYSHQGILPDIKVEKMMQKRQIKYRKAFIKLIEGHRKKLKLPELKINREIQLVNHTGFTKDLISKLESKIRLLLEDCASDKILHKIRILVKRMVYIHEMNEKAGYGTLLPAIYFDGLVQIQRDIGRWHDCQVILTTIAKHETEASIFISTLYAEMITLRSQVVERLNAILSTEILFPDSNDDLIE